MNLSLCLYLCNGNLIKISRRCEILIKRILLNTIKVLLRKKQFFLVLFASEYYFMESD